MERLESRAEEVALNSPGNGEPGKDFELRVMSFRKNKPTTEWRVEWKQGEPGRWRPEIGLQD